MNNNILNLIAGILLTANIALLGHVGAQVYRNSIAIAQIQVSRFTNQDGEQLAGLLQKLNSKIDLQFQEVNQRLENLEKDHDHYRELRKHGE